ncbi:hypothetical protein TIFTF001_008765 [Ficus carica]|uniref:Uncharacterized protein n=1 Tax=Ficus carica TaxID=3494 RepID=A0AA87ZM03_FICCA|nr:hypothetical protein TIFTF001_008765 [Ficus carica]
MAENGGQWRVKNDYGGEGCVTLDSEKEKRSCNLRGC